MMVETIDGLILACELSKEDWTPFFICADALDDAGEWELAHAYRYAAEHKLFPWQSKKYQNNYSWAWARNYPYGIPEWEPKSCFIPVAELKISYARFNDEMQNVYSFARVMQRLSSFLQEHGA